jgi:hypothetical protein
LGEIGIGPVRGRSLSIVPRRILPSGCSIRSRSSSGLPDRTSSAEMRSRAFSVLGQQQEVLPRVPRGVDRRRAAHLAAGETELEQQVELRARDRHEPRIPDPQQHERGVFDFNVLGLAALRLLGIVVRLFDKDLEFNPRSGRPGLPRLLDAPGLLGVEADFGVHVGAPYLSVPGVLLSVLCGNGPEIRRK